MSSQNGSADPGSASTPTIHGVVNNNAASAGERSGLHDTTVYAAGSAGSSQEPENSPPQLEQSKKVDVSHFPHYGLKRGMACTFCRRRKLRCSGDRPQCTNCIKYTKHCEYGPPVKSEKKKQQQQQQQQQQQHQAHQPQQQQQMYHLPQQAGYSGSSFNANGMPAGPSAPDSFRPQQQLSASSMYGSQPSTVDYNMGAMLMDSNILGQSSYSSDMPYSVNAIGPDFHHASSFVSTSMSAGQSSLLDGQLSRGQQQHVAQPIIGMPPYVPPTGPETFAFPGVAAAATATTAAAAMQNAWMQTPSSAYPTPQNSTGYAATTSAQTQSSMFTDSSMTAEPMYDPSVSQEPGSAYITRLASDPSTPDDRAHRRGGSGRVSGHGGSSGEATPELNNRYASKMYNQTNLHYVSNLNPVDGLTERLGEFLFSPNASAVKDEETTKRSKAMRSNTGTQDAVNGQTQASPGSISRMRTEYDGLMESSRTLLLDCFLEHSGLFFEMSVPRFRYRMSFSDRRRPSLALLNAMYLWATRISNSPQMVSMEKHFFEEACKHLDISTSTVDRLIDAVRGAMLLSAYSHSTGRHHEGWCLAGLANRLVLSCGLHRIQSNVHKPEASKNPFLRNRVFLLPPPVDAVELGERLHAFWAVLATDRCGSLATGYPSGLRDEDITTPFARHLTDIASGNVSERDDYTLKDLYLGRGIDASNDTPYVRWVKCVAILERASKLSFLEPAEDSPYTQAWNQYHLTLHRDPYQTPPAETLNQPKYRNPGDYRECLLAIEQMVSALGEDGVFPIVRKMHAQQDGAPEPETPTPIIMLHHMICAVHMMLNDINSLDVENTEALKAARKSVMLFRGMAQIPFTDVDAFLVLIWSLIAKVLIKEAHRLTKLGDSEGARSVASEADTVIGEMARIGQTMYLARTQAKAVEELKEAALSLADDVNGAPQLESFMFPQHM